MREHAQADANSEPGDGRHLLSARRTSDRVCTALAYAGPVVDPAKVQSLQGSIKFAAGTYEITFSSTKGGEAKESGTVSTRGALLQFARACPSTMTEAERRDSATVSSFDLFDVSDAALTAPTEVATYTRE